MPGIVARVRDRVLRYQVISNTRHVAATMDMGAVIWPSSRPRDEEWITLITCGGDFNPSVGSYEDNVVAYAVPVTT